MKRPFAVRIREPYSLIERLGRPFKIQFYAFMDVYLYKSGLAEDWFRKSVNRTLRLSTCVGKCNSVLRIHTISQLLFLIQSHSRFFLLRISYLLRISIVVVVVSSILGPLSMPTIDFSFFTPFTFHFSLESVPAPQKDDWLKNDFAVVTPQNLAEVACKAAAR